MTDAVLEARVKNLEAELDRLRARNHELGNAVTKLQEQAAQRDALPDLVTQLRIEVASLKARVLTVGAVLAMIMPPLTALAMRLAPSFMKGPP
jgi:hypothetical protein